jgi:hypothetical protein
VNDLGRGCTGTMTQAGNTPETQSERCN